MRSSSTATALAVIALILSTVGCSGNTGPVLPPDQTPQTTPESRQSQSSRALWGLWQIRINAETSEAEAIPIRGAEWHLNAVQFLEPSRHSTIVLRDIYINGASVELNVGLTHPFPGLYQWSGFDARGIFIADGSYNEFQSDGDIVIAKPSEPHLLNPDGWTRWWNPQEFPVRGSLLGYQDGVYGVPDSQVNYRATLNGYKYFCDDLGQNEEFPEDLDFDRRGFFLASSNVNYRHYSIDFGQTSNWYMFNYAVDASHQFKPGTDGNSTPSLSSLPDPFFPIEANMPEALAVQIIEETSTLYYAGPTEFGGDLFLTFGVYDWQGMRREDGIRGEIKEVIVESPKLLGDQPADVVPIDNDDPHYSMYVAELHNCHPDGLNNQQVLITVISEEGSYKTGYDGFSTSFIGNADLSAYQIFIPHVSPDIPVQTEIITVTDPNGGEIWLSGSTHDITWLASSSIDFVQIDYSANGGTSWNPVGGGIYANSGSCSWDIPSDLASGHMLIRISDASDGDPFDTSDSEFAIESLTVLFPNGPGDDLEVGVQTDIEWETGSGTTDVIQYVKIEFSKNGLSGPFALLPGAGNVANTGSWAWTPAVGDVTTEGRIRITDVDHSILTDTSDGNFEVFEKHELTLSEYMSWFTGGTKNYRGRYHNSLSGLSQNYYNGTITSWDFTTTPISSYLGTGNFNMTFTSGVPLIAGAPSWGTNHWGMRTSIGGPAGRRAWWVFRFDTAAEKLYNRGSTYYIDATFDDITLPGWCIDYVECDMTEQFAASTTNDIQFPIDEGTATTSLGGSGVLYWVNHYIDCSPHNDQWNVSYQSGSEWDVVAFGDVTVPDGDYPHCLLIKLKANIGPTTQIVHTGQLLYQWIDCDSGTVVAFIWSHNEGNSTVGIPYTTGYNGDQVLMGIIGALN